MVLVNQTREDNNVNDLSTSNTHTSKDITNNVLIMFDPPIPCDHPSEFEIDEMSGDYVIIYADQFNQCYISNGVESYGEDRNGIHPLILN